MFLRVPNGNQIPSTLLCFQIPPDGRAFSSGWISVDDKFNFTGVVYVTLRDIEIQISFPKVVSSIFDLKEHSEENES